jgi:hypothetical protein
MQSALLQPLQPADFAFSELLAALFQSLGNTWLRPSSLLNYGGIHCNEICKTWSI